MMRLLLYFLILLASVWLGLQIHQDPGYVLINYRHWSLETTLWFAILAIVVLFFLLYLLLRLLRGTTNISGRLRNWTDRRRYRKANQQTNRGLCELAEGEWKAAEKNLIGGARHSEIPLINYLAAAGAAQKQGHYEERDGYLRSAHSSDPQAEVAIGLTQAQLQIDAKQWELALATLRHLQQITPNHNYALKLLQRTYLELRDWQSLEALLPNLKKYKVFKPEMLNQIESRVYLQLMTTATASASPEAVTKMWQGIPSSLQHDSKIFSVYVDYLIKKGDGAAAETLLREELKKNWSPELVQRYGLAQGENATRQLTTAESWLKNHGNDPVLLLCLGRLCLRNQLWGKARDYLETSLQIEPHAPTYYELGQLLEQLNEGQAALDCYRKGLALVS